MVQYVAKRVSFENSKVIFIFLVERVILAEVYFVVDLDSL
jgi:hypothetical protein